MSSSSGSRDSGLAPVTAWFRLPLPFVACWGARAILQGRGSQQYIDLLPDRQQLWVAPGADGGAFRAWVRGTLLAWLDERCGKPWIDPTGADLLALQAPPVQAEACANQSGGYLYIGAWQLPG